MGSERWTWVTVGLAVTAAAVPLLPFSRSGARLRSGYELVRTAQSAGFLPGPIGRVAIVALAVLPLLAAAAFTAASLRRRVAVATLAAMAGVIVAAAGLAARRAPIGAEPGTGVAVVVGCAAIGTAVAGATAALRTRP